MTRAYRFWTREELKIVKDSYLERGPKECSVLVGRPIWSIHQAAMRLKLSDPHRQRRWRSKINPPEKDIQASERYGTSVFRVYLVGNEKFGLVEERDLPKVLKHRWRAFKPRKVCYAYTSVKRDALYMHNLIMGTSRGIEIDHRNRNGLDNVRKNLRKSDRSTNSCNRPANRNNTSGYKGVTFDRRYGKWRSVIGLNNKTYFLGYFKTAKEAARAYNRGAVKHHGSFAYLNEI